MPERFTTVPPVHLNRSQRVVLVVGWGLALYFSASYLAGRLASPGSAAWFNYAPNNGVTYGGSASRSNLWLWLAAVTLWLVGALWLMRSPRPPAPGDD